MGKVELKDLDLDTGSLEVTAAEGSEPLDGENKALVPLSSIVGNYNPHRAAITYQMNRTKLKEHYQFEKAMGHRLPNGTKPLKNITPRHILIASKFMSGAGVNQIALSFRCTASTISRILHDPKIAGLIKIGRDAYDEELKNLLPLAVEAIRGALCDPNVKTRLAAVDRFARMTGKGTEPLEDSGDVTINIISVREKFVNDLREMAETAKIIDVTPEAVSESAP